MPNSLIQGRTLVICPIGIGNFIMATPALEALNRVLGRENLHFLALKPEIKAFADASRWFGRVHFWDPDQQPLLHGIRLVLTLRKQGFEHTVSLFPSGHWKFCLFNLLTGAGGRFGFKYEHTVLPNWIQTRSLPLVKGIHDAEQNLALVQHFLGQPVTLPKALSLTIPCEYTGKELLNKQGYFSCHPGSSNQRGMLEKRLPPDRFAELISRIHHRFGLKGALLGGPEERDLRREILDKIPDALVDLPSERLNETAAIIRQSVFFMGNDSGLMHMAVALGKVCIAFFGPSDESRTGPYFLARDSVRDRSSLSRGHLVIRGRKTGEAAPAGNNPRLRFRQSRSLENLNAEAAWKMMEPFIENILS